MLEGLGKEIEQKRAFLGYTQKDLADLADLSDTTIRNIEKGKPGVSIGHWLTVADLLGLTISIHPKQMIDEARIGI